MTDLHQKYPLPIYSNASFCLRANAPLNNRSQSSNILTEFDNIEKNVGQNLEPKQTISVSVCRNFLFTTTTKSSTNFR